MFVLSAIILAVCGGIFIKNTFTETYETIAIPGNLGISGTMEEPGKDMTGISDSDEANVNQDETVSGDMLSSESMPEEALPEIALPEEIPTEKDPVLVFAGDVLLSNHVTNAYDKAGGIGGMVDAGYLEDMKHADIFMVNQEFPFSSRGVAAEDKQYTFRLPPERRNILQEMGIDIVTLANNHTLDFGREALLDTGKTLDEAGILYVGAGENLERAKKLEVMEVQGKKIGFLAASRVIPESGWNANSYTPGLLTTYDPAALVEEIKKARAVCDYVVVYVHWGIERAERPEEYQRTLGKQYIDAGADMVIGSHPHVLQGLEYYNGKPIVYSLGNFVFGSSIPKTMLLRVDLKAEGLKLTLLPGTSGGGYTRKLQEEAGLLEFYRYMESISYGVGIEGGVVVPR